MKRVMCLAVLSALLIGGGVVLYKNSERFRVLINKGGKKVDEAIGPNEIEREKAETRVKDLEAAVDRLETEQFKTEEAAKSQQKRVTALEKKINAVELAMADVQQARSSVSEGKTAPVRGKDYTEAELKKLAKDLVDKRKEWTNDLPEQKDKLQKLEARAARFKERKDELAQEVVAIKKDLKAIDDKMKEIEALKSASGAMGDADKTVGENLEGLKKSVSDLNASLTVRLNKEDRHWQNVGKSGADEADKFIEAGNTPSDPYAEIDAILKNKK